MTITGQRRVALAMFMLSMGFCVAGLLILVTSTWGLVSGEDSWGIPGLSVIFGSGYALVGWLVTSRQPSNPIGWLLSAIGLVASISSFAEGYIHYSFLVAVRPLPGAEIVNWHTAWGWMLTFGFISFLVLLFPTGHLASPRWRFLAWAIPLATAWSIVLTAIAPGPMETSVVTRPNPWGIGSIKPITDNLSGSAAGPLMLCLLAAAASMIVRFRRSVGEERAQLKWLAYAALLHPVTLLMFVSVQIAGLTFLYDALETLNSLAVVGIAFAVGLAILRYRLYDIDVLINRTLVYGALTAALGVAYFGSVLLISRLLEPVTQESDFAVAGATLAVFALFQPVRVRLQSTIDRRFYRAKYDAAQALEELGSSLKDEVELSALLDRVTSVVDETLRPAWAKVAPVEDEDQLREEGADVLLPLIAQGELVGVLAVGKPLSGREYSVDDRRFLARLGELTAPALRVGQLVLEQEEQARVQERVEQEMRIAQLIQKQFLPAELPAFPGWQVAAFYRPAREVGGDFYDFIELSDGRLMIVAGDVTDKGVPAALVMASTRSILRGEAARTSSPADVLRYANEQLCRDTPESMFVTCLCVVIDPVRGGVVLANAGHNLPYINRDGVVIELRATGMPLGLLPTSAYEDVEATLVPGDRVLLCSDGLIEAHNPQGELFGFDRTKDAMGSLNGDGAPDRTIDHMLDRLHRFTGDAWEQEDDITMVALEYSSVAARAFEGVNSMNHGRQLVSFSIDSSPGGERAVMERVAEAVAGLGLSQKRLDALKTAVSEAAMNAIEHGSDGDEHAVVDVVVTASESELEVAITDRGGGRAGVEVDAPDLAAKLEGRQKPRGWGLFLIKNLVDEVREEDSGELHKVELMMRLSEAAS